MNPVFEKEFGMDLHYFDKLWKENRYSGGSTSQENESFWDERAHSMEKWKKRRNGNHQKVLDFLQHKKMLQSGFSVLDIGCGPGEHTKNLALVAKKVVGTDISKNMLKYAQKKTAEKGLSNTEFIKTDWEEVDLSRLNWERKFDLVFAAMTPAIGSRKSLEKMIQASKQYCFSSYPVSRQTAIREKLEAHINADYVKHIPCNTVYCLVNMLFLLGYYPVIYYENKCWECEMSVDQALDHFSIQMLNKNDNSSKTLLAIREYLQDVAKQDLVTEVVESKIAWVSWEV